MIVQVINILVTLVLVYLLWNKKYVTNVHLNFSISLDEDGRIVFKKEQNGAVSDTTDDATSDTVGSQKPLGK